MSPPWRARLPWFAVWVPMALLLYTLVNGAGHIRPLYLVWTGLLPDQISPELDFVFRATTFLCGPWVFLIVPVLSIFAYASWKLCPEWSSSVRWMAGMLSVLLCVLFLLVQGVLFCPLGWLPGTPSWSRLRIIAVQLWKPHLCRPVLEPLDPENPSVAWKAQASEFVAFLHDPDPYVFQAAAELFVRLGDKSEIPYLVKSLESVDPRMRGPSAAYLANLGDKSAVPRIAELLDDAGPGVCQNAAEAIRELSGEKWPEDVTLVDSARAWWEKHKDDPEWKPK